MNVVFVSESCNLLLVYGKVDNIVYFDKKLAVRLLGLPPVAMTTTVVYHTFAMQRGRPLKFVLYHKVVLGVKNSTLVLDFKCTRQNVHQRPNGHSQEVSALPV